MIKESWVSNYSWLKRYMFEYKRCFVKLLLITKAHSSVGICSFGLYSLGLSSAVNYAELNEPRLFFRHLSNLFAFQLF